MRRLLHVAMTRARARLVLAYPEATDRGAVQHAVAVRRGGARGASAASGRRARRSCSGPAETLQSTFRLLRDELLTDGRAGRRAARRAALRHRPRRLARRRALPRAAQARRAARAHARRRAVGRRRAARGQRAAAAGRDRRAARDLRDVARSTSTCSTPSATSGCARGRWRRAPSRRWRRSCPAAATGWCLSASDIETYRTCPLKYKFARVFRIPSEPTINQRFGILVHQVLERFHAGGAGVALAARAARAAGGGLAPRRLRRLRGGAPAAREGDAGAGPLPRALPGRGRRAGLVRARLPVQARARTCCAGASTASTGCPTAATS